MLYKYMCLVGFITRGLVNILLSRDISLVISDDVVSRNMTF